MAGGGVFGTGYLGEYFFRNTPTFEKTAQVLALSPKPVRGRLQFSGFAEMGVGELRIFSSFGHEVFHENGFRLENGLDVGRLLAGAYFVRFAAGGKEFVGRFVRE